MSSERLPERLSDQISPYTQTKLGKAREIDFVEGVMVYSTHSLEAKKRRNREMVAEGKRLKIDSPFDRFFKEWIQIYGN